MSVPKENVDGLRNWDWLVFPFRDRAPGRGPVIEMLNAGGRDPRRPEWCVSVSLLLSLRYAN